MLDIYATLEIKQVLDNISFFARGEIAKDRIENLKMLSNLNEAKLESQKLDEMIILNYRHGELPIEVSFNLSNYIDFAKKGGILTPLDLDHVASDVLTCLKINNYFRKIERSKYPLIIEIVDKLFDLTDLEKAIHRVISPNLTILDNASPELARIRRQIYVKEDDLRKLTLSLVNRYKDNLNEATYTIRGDHFVLPVKTSDKSKIPGIIHDISDSGMTTFIEPAPLVELSNNIFILKNKEKEEITRLLKELTQKVISLEEQIVTNNVIIAELDFLNAKAKYAIENQMEAPDFVEDERIIDFENARHPLINKDVVVPNTFYLDKSQRLIVISGPNAGGKTVALKTLGLLVMMAEMGLALPTSKKARLSFFPKIFADIGDNQSLSDNLSTFSAHISNISRITHFVSPNDLVLIDELGTGTSPKEGEAIAISVIEFLFNKECFALISSHFDQVKEYAYSKDGIVNAMMIFDDTKLLPTYKLHIGLPGRSYGLEMAKRYHLDEDIIKSAKKRLARNKKTDINDTIEKLNKLILENEEIKASLKEKERLNAIKETELKNKEENLNDKKENLLKDVEETREKLIEEAKEQIKDALRVLSNPKVTQKELLAAREELDEIIKEEEFELSNENLNLGDYVKVEDLGLMGKIVSIKGDNLNVITSEGMTLKIDRNKVKKTNEKPRKVIQPSAADKMVKIKSDVKLELNIIGEHIDEAKDHLAKYLDDARLKHFKTVRIVHGKGSGALRNLVRDYLAKCSFVEEFHSAGYYDGGDGATVVTLK